MLSARFPPSLFEFAEKGSCPCLRFLPLYASSRVSASLFPDRSLRWIFRPALCCSLQPAHSPAVEAALLRQVHPALPSPSQRHGCPAAKWARPTAQPSPPPAAPHPT